MIYFLLGPYVHMHAIHKEIKIQGFNTPSYYGKYDEATAQLTKWIQEVHFSSVDF